VSAVIFIISFRLKILCWFIANNREVSQDTAAVRYIVRIAIL